MQIHELNNFTGTLGSGAYLAIDDGNDTGKISSQGLLAATEARIDNIIAGDAPSAAEVVDARLGADGVTYSSLGTGIRTQFTDVKSALAILTKEVNGMHRLDLMWEQGNINASGEQSNSKVIRTTDYYSAVDVASLIPNIRGNYVVTLVTYSGNTDPATEFVGYITVTDGVSVIPDGTYSYFRIKMQKSSSEVIAPSEGENLIIRVKDHIDIEETHRDAVGAMVEIAETYFNVAYDPNDQIIYHTQRGLYSPETEYEGTKAIVCSQFVTACFSGTPFDFSRYLGEKNESYWWGLKTDGTGTYGYDDYMISANMAQYCQDKGWLHTFDIDHNDMKPGDLAFYSSDSEISNVGHVAIVLAVGANRYTFMEASANNKRLVDGEDVALVCITTAYSNKMPTFYAHIPVVPSEYKTKILLQDETKYTQTVESGTANIKTYPLLTNLEKGFYSFACDYLGDGYPYVKLTYEDGQTRNFSRDEVSTDKYSVMIYAQMPVKSIEVRCSGTGNHAVSNIKFRKGFFVY